MEAIKKGMWSIILLAAILTFNSCKKNDETPRFTFPENETIHLDSQEKLDAFGALGHTTFEEAIVIGTANEPNTGITNLDALSTLTAVAGLTVHYNNELKTLRGLDELQSITGDLIIDENPALATVGGLSRLKFIGGSSIIIMNGIMANLDGLNTLKNIGGDLIIDENPGLSSIGGLISLKTIGGSTIIIMNGLIEDLFGLKNLEEISGDIIIRENPLLKDFCGLKPLILGKGFSGKFEVSDNGSNPSLSEINKMFCN